MATDDDHVRSLDQAQTKVTHVQIEGIALPQDVNVIHKIVGSHSMDKGLIVDDDLMMEDFRCRPAIAAAPRGEHASR